MTFIDQSPQGGVPATVETPATGLAALFGSSAPEFTVPFSIWDISLVLALSFGLALIIGKTYQMTHKGISYSQGNVQTYVLMAVIISLIMLIIGSNIARAFSLVGALSIVRFRNAVKESRDVGFVFWAMAIGMACGTRFYAQAVLATVTIAVFVFIMHYFNFFARTVRERILLVEVDAGQRCGGSLRRALHQHIPRALPDQHGNDAWFWKPATRLQHNHPRQI